MGKKMSLASLFLKPSPWRPWPSCKQPRTLSFRAAAAAAAAAGDVYKTHNSVFLDDLPHVLPEESPAESPEDYSCFTTSTSGSLSSDSAGEGEGEEEWLRGLASDRFFFEPAGDTKSIVKEAAAAAPYKESVAVAVESADPYADFRASMAEMVAALGLREWERLEELLLWYLRMNGKNNHGFIVGAFLDLLITLLSPPSSDQSQEQAPAQM